MKLKTGKLIKELRIKKGITQEELANLTELSARTIQRIENGEVHPRAYTLKMIAISLDVDISLFTETSSEGYIENNKENERIWLALIHLSGLFLLIFPTVLIWENKKDQIKGITDHYKDVINFQLTNWLIFMLPGILALVFIKLPFAIYLAIILNGIISIVNSIKVLNGVPYRYFFAYKFQKRRKKKTPF